MFYNHSAGRIGAQIPSQVFVPQIGYFPCH